MRDVPDEGVEMSPAELRRRLRPAPAHRTVTRRSMDGAEIGRVDLDPDTFGIEPNAAVLHQVVTAQLAAARAGTQSTKTRAEVRGGGTKPFRQKGTGRSRQGSTRAPQWSGGGVALGPKPRSYAQRTPKKMVRLALRSALSDRAAMGRVALVDAWSFEVPRTKDAMAALGALGLTGRVLLVIGPTDGTADRSFGNLPDVQTILADELNAYDVLVNDWVVFTDVTLPGGDSQDGHAEVVGEAPGAEAVGAPDVEAVESAEVGEEAAGEAAGVRAVEPTDVETIEEPAEGIES